MSQAISRIRSGSLADPNKLKKYIMVRKGKALLVRALKHLGEENMKVCIYSNIFKLEKIGLHNSKLIYY